jgi:hypothetical protein
MYSLGNKIEIENFVEPIKLTDFVTYFLLDLKGEETTDEFEEKLSYIFEELNKILLNTSTYESLQYIRETFDRISTCEEIFNNNLYREQLEDLVFKYYPMVFEAFVNTADEGGGSEASQRIYNNLIKSKDFASILEKNRSNTEEFLRSKANTTKLLTIEDLEEIGQRLQEGLFSEEFKGIRKVNQTITINRTNESDRLIEISKPVNVRGKVARSHDLYPELERWLSEYNKLITSEAPRSILLIRLAALLQDFASHNLHPYSDMNGTIIMYLGVYFAHIKFGEEIAFERNNIKMVRQKIFQNNPIAAGLFAWEMFKSSTISVRTLRRTATHYFKNKALVELVVKIFQKIKY